MACEHEHHHDHDHDHDHGHTHEHAHGEFTVKVVDGATVGSMHIDCPCADVSAFEQRLAAELKRVSKAIETEGGIVGHAKASLEQSSVSKISVIDEQTTIDHALVPQVRGDIAVIAFAVSQERMQELLATIELG